MGARCSRRALRWLAVTPLTVVTACDGGGGSSAPVTTPAAVTATAPAATGPVSAASPVAAGPDLLRLLEDPTMTGEHQLPAHAPLHTYADADAAVADDRSSPWEVSLDGTWSFALVDRPDEVPDGFWRDGFDAAGWRRVDVPHTWQSDGLDHPIFRNIATEMVPDDPPHPPRDVNPTGAYVRDVELPDDWTSGRRTIVRFDGVTSAWALWVNGRYVGADQGGYLPAEFDVTDVVRPGTNRIAVQVHRWSAGSYLEDYDQWRFSGIFRSVSLRSVPDRHIADVTITTDLDDAMADATLRVAARVVVGDAPGVGEAAHVVARLWGPGRTATHDPVAVLTGDVPPPDGTVAEVAMSTRVEGPSLWSDESPALYALTIDLVGDDGDVLHSVRQPVGFREIAVVDGELRLNGHRMVVRGVNRTETDPDTGRHQTRERMEADLHAMKRLNVNAVRTAHAPADPAFYDLADELGILVVDEVEVETHNHQTCPADCLADRPEWEPAMLDRYTGMVARDKNHPSVVMWSTGNEAGLGAAHAVMAQWSREHDPTRPLIHQSNEPDGDAPYADVAAPRYLSLADLAAADTATAKPIVMGEYAHTQGNGLGHFHEYWEVVRGSRHVQGGFVWDWADQDQRASLVTTPDRSGHDIAAMLSGRPEIVPGRRGQAVSLSGLDDTVEIYRDPVLDITGTALTIDAVVAPREPAPGGFTMLSKGEQYSLGATAAGMLELAVTSGGERVAVEAPPPAGWASGWHRVTGTYDGTMLRLYVDGAPLAERPLTGGIDHSGYHVAVGRDTATMAELYGGRTATGVVDQVRVYDVALDGATIARGDDPVDQAVLALDFDEFTDGGTYLSYGLYESGTDGLVTADRVPQPETTELASVLAPIRIGDEDARNGLVRVRNERAARDASDLELRWRITEGAATLESGTAPLDVAPGDEAVVSLPVTATSTDGPERFLGVEAVTIRDEAWADAGHVVSSAQFAVGGPDVPRPDDVPTAGPGALVVSDGADVVEVRAGDRVVATVDKRTGTLTSMRVDGRELLHTGPSLDVWRAPISNETAAWGGAEAASWRAVGLDRLTTTVTGVDVETGGDTAQVVVRSVAAASDVADASFDQTMRFSFDATGTVRISHAVTPVGRVRELPYLPRIGMQLAVVDSLSSFSWYGRGPGENYRDRNRGSPIGVYETSVDEQYVEHRRPQDHGNHTDVRWVVLRDDAGGLLAVADGAPLEAAVSSYDAAERAPYPHMLRRNDGWTTLHLSAAASGVGDIPHSVQPQYAVAADTAVEYAVTLVPL